MLMKPTEGNLNAGDLRFGIVVSKFNEFVTGRLEAATLETLKKHGALRGAPAPCSCARGI